VLFAVLGVIVDVVIDVNSPSLLANREQYLGLGQEWVLWWCRSSYGDYASVVESRGRKICWNVVVEL
jgi:hypothetical protein